MKKKLRNTDPSLEKALAAALKRNTPQSRFLALELMRRIKYGKAATGRMEKVIEIVRADGSIQRLSGNR